MKFVSHKTKVRVFHVKKVNRAKLVDQYHLNITEDLTNETCSLVKAIRAMECVEKAWTIDGKIHAKVRGIQKPPFNIKSKDSILEATGGRDMEDMN